MKYSLIDINIFTLILLAISFHSANLSAAEETLPLSSYFTETWNTGDGLPHNGINAISQTSDGYLWIATWGGLARFNGREFTIFSRGSSAGLPDSAVKSLTATPSGKLLVAGARGGISERYKNQWSSGQPAETMINHAIYDNNQNLWLALEGQGLVYRDMKTHQDTVIINDLRAYKILQDNKGTIWVATNKGLFSVTDKTLVRHFDQKYGLPNKSVQDLILTHDKHLVVATQQGVYKFIDGNFKSLHTKLVNDRVNSLLEDSAQNLWIGTDNRGLFRLSNNKLEQLSNQTDLPKNKISTLFQDKERSIWIGTNSGLFRLREVPFVTVTTKHGLSGNYIRSILSHSDGSLWVGSSKGLNKLDNNEISAINETSIGKKLSILSLAEAPDKQVLVGTYHSGLFITTENGLEELLTTKDGLPSNEVRSILVDSSKNIWIGTSYGLVKASPNNKIEVFNKESGLPANFIMALAEDQLGKVWIGTGEGIASFSQGDIQAFSLDDQFDAEYAFGFHVENNSLWMATDRGLVNIDVVTNAVSAVTKEDGLPVDKIFQIVEDKNNTFWLTSNNGVINVNKSAINDVLQKRTKYVDYNFFSQGFSLLNFQINSGSTPSATLHNDGNVWVATAKGVSYVDESRLKTMSQTTIPVVIEQLEVDGKYYPIMPSVILPAGTSQVTIHYAGLGYLMPKHISYQTKLVGFDKKWKNKHKNTFTEFTSLAPGNYTFHMRAKYPNGKWQDNLATINFIITPYYWQTTWFKLIIVILLLLSLYIIYRYRMIAIQRSQIKLKELVAQQTLELQNQSELFSYQAKHDQLTGLCNRRAFDEWCNDDLKEANKNSKPLTIAILDIDHFKSVNDDYSHLTGDKVIKKVADTLLDLAQKSSQQIKLARWGGEEFTLLINHDVDKSYDFCELVRLTIKKQNLSHLADDLSITISIGLTDNKEIHEYDKMLSHADQALYFAKQNGRDQVQIYQANNHENSEK
ncbi:ligand-binding sensor domain-containing diguanylate cyclase [uncultured Paraglaciecola sp.]|uniref:ligand-binding sensor domain-containing protein n=1 Tax=uncultured Paraglaciecola sp. TaxID=1765024 RepID=UPI0025981E99|nr:ligand-binding sensor domain-containing diguanylate cyclase [uncultured Paraglaciecola sp.]